MAKFRLELIGELARQMAFTPLEVRLTQLSAAEELLLEIDPAKAYPFDFIIFRITAYRPKRVGRELLTGLALQHDLGLLIERVSQTTDSHQVRQSQPVLTIDEVTQRFNVTSKTVQRWRRRGLAARIFTFPDGKRRVGFLFSTVERFFAIHRDQVAQAGNFSIVTEAEKSRILKWARRLAEGGRSSAGEIARRIGRRLHRAPLTITHLVKSHDQQNPRSAIFPTAAPPFSNDQCEEIYSAFRGGEPVKILARRLARASSEIYRVIIEQRLARLNRRRMRFIDDPIYHQPDAAEVIEQIVAQEELADPSSKQETRIPRDLPPYLQDLYRTPLLSSARERALFLKLNFHKFEFVTARRKLDPALLTARKLNRLEALRRRVMEAKNRIVRANLRLVVSVARKHLRPNLFLMDLISDGNLTLMRAVESFDCHKGNRFSTYATLALMKGFARSVPQMQARDRRAIADVAALSSVSDARPTREVGRMLDRDQVEGLLSRLAPRERDVITQHYGLNQRAPATYEQVGYRLGLSKQRVRQIEQTALAKLRADI
ncbi:MAG: sigma-70 family RNA polymerase sigma factor [Tepidisphaeraceae bacterium]|jgi:RNA polymerase sigma factor (sigma-70 family)